MTLLEKKLFKRFIFFLKTFVKNPYEKFRTLYETGCDATKFLHTMYENVREIQNM